MSTSEYPARGIGRPRLPSTRAAMLARALSAEGWIVCALVLVATVVRILVIDNQSFWVDEALTAYETRISFGAMLNVVAHVETTPPLYFVVIWIWAHVLGTGEVALRSLSTLAGIATVPIAYLAGSELASRRAGVLAAAFVALNPFLIWYSQEARAYMLLVALSGASFLYFARARNDPSRRNLAWWAIWSSLALTTHFFAGFLVGPEAVWLLYLHRRRAGFAVLAVALVQLATLPFALLDTSHGTGWIAATPRSHRLSQAILEWGVSIVYRRTPISVGLIAGGVLVALVALLVALGGDRRTRDAARVGVLVGGFVWVAPLVLGYLGQDYFLSRNVMPAVVPFAVVLAAACVAPRVWILGGVLAVVLLAMFAIAGIRVQTHPYLQRPDWRAVARALGPASTSRAILAADGTTADPLKIYLPGVSWSEPHGRRLWIKEIDVVGALKPMAVLPPPPTFLSLSESGVHYPLGRTLPATQAPRGARLLARFRVRNWVLARFELDRPIRLSIGQVSAVAGRFFRHTPVALLAFFQPAAPVHLHGY